DLLSSRAVVKPGMYAIIPPEGRVFNVIPGIEGCRMTILCTPKMGAGFVQHIGTALPGGGTTVPYGASGQIETFIYVLDGEGSLTVTVGGRTEVMPQGGYAYAPAGVGISFRNGTDKPLRFLLYKQRYIPHPKGLMPWSVFGNINEVAFRDYDGMANVHVKDFLPVEEAFDMNMHILSFDPGASHNICETHVQEHGAYIYEGEGMYLLDDTWYMTKKEDFLWMGAFSVQAGYGIGRGPFSYIYSKDCNRDVEI
ncbi:MAG: cupin domain-containing protein, partial [Sutterella wadsworthensis]|nr:cupin domain-containing protein [Sutterella wadsworthensis]